MVPPISITWLTKVCRWLIRVVTWVFSRVKKEKSNKKSMYEEFSEEIKHLEEQTKLEEEDK